ncbi:MAG: toprim domain-containing protein [Nitrospirae bacterium]|nr:toprim domain-containing protein [Nitrospirota bacterium]
MSQDAFDAVKRLIPIEDVARDLGIDITGPGRARCFNTNKGHHRDPSRDNHPSLHFLKGNKGYGHYHCRVCGKDTSGSVIDLVMAIQGKTAHEAIDWLKDRYKRYLPSQTATHQATPPSLPHPPSPSGAAETSSLPAPRPARQAGIAPVNLRVPTSDEDSRPTPGGDPSSAVAATEGEAGKKQAGASAALIYARVMELCPPGPRLYGYLEKERGIPGSVTKTLPMGWIEDDRQVMNTLRREFSEEELLACGVLTVSNAQKGNKDARPFSVLWNMKLAFPFYWGSEITWIQFRRDIAMDTKPEKGPKFLNVGMPLQYPYNANAAVHSEEIYISEGILDLAQLVVLGVKNGVALPGADMFKDHFIPWLHECGVKRVHMCFDADPTGTKHTLDIAGKLLRAGFLTTAAILPMDEDVNSFWRGHPENGGKSDGDATRAQAADGAIAA